MNTSKLPVKHILLIDNDEDEYEILQSAVSEVDATIKVQYTDRCHEETPLPSPLPDLIFLDINMPGYDGFDWLARIRREASVPVIMYSTSRSGPQVDKAFEMGANLFITKPNRTSDLVRLLKEILVLNWAEPADVTRRLQSQGAYHLPS